MREMYTIFEQTINGEAVGKLEIDDNGTLHWNGSPVLTKQAVTLDRLVARSIVITAIATATMALVSIVSLYTGP